MGKLLSEKKIWMVLVSFLMVHCGTNNKTSETDVSGLPNVILILADDMGIGDLSCYGQETISTPHIDRMAAEGMRFTNFYTGSAVCAPSRASLLTGKHTGHTSVRGNMPEQLLSDNDETIAKIMKKAGYVTGCIGKWGVGHPPPPDDPQKKGFDHFFGYINMWHAHNFYPEFLYRNGEKVLLKNKLRLVDGQNPWKDMPEGTGVAAVREEYVHDLFDREAFDFMGKNKDQKFFLYLAYNAPHANNEAYPNGMEVPGYKEFKDMDWPDQEKGFAAMIRNIDNSVGMVLKKVKDLGLDDKTMVIFCSDNGPHQEGGHVMEFFNSNSNYRGGKRDFYDGGVRTPFIVRYLGVVEDGSSTGHLSAFWDILPTFCDLTGVKKTGDTDGISFLPVLFGNQEKQEEHNYLYWEFFEQGGKQAILQGNWKAVKLNVRGRSTPVVFELYDLSGDPGETVNVAEQFPEKVKEFETLFRTARKEFPVVSLFSKDTKTVETPF